MGDVPSAVKGKAFNLKGAVDYADGSVVSKTLIKADAGNVTLFAFDAGQGLSEHRPPLTRWSTYWTARLKSPFPERSKP